MLGAESRFEKRLVGFANGVVDTCPADAREREQRGELDLGRVGATRLGELDETEVPPQNGRVDLIFEADALDCRELVGVAEGDDALAAEGAARWADDRDRVALMTRRRVRDRRR